ncbi:glycosyl hydrolase family 18 protein [Paenibacillus marinisediminis]
MKHGRDKKRRSKSNKGLKRSRKRGYLLILLGVCLLTVAAWQGWKEWMPNFEYAAPDTSVKQPISWNGEMTTYSAAGSGRSLLIPLSALQERIMPQAIYESESNLVILTDDTHVATVPLNSSEGTLDGKVKDWKLPAQNVNGDIYVPSVVLEELGVVKTIEYPASGVVQLVLPGEELQYGQIVSSVKADKQYAMRQEPNKKSPIVKEIAAGTKVTLWGEQDGWYRIQEDEGLIGYIPSSEIEVTTTWKMPQAEKLEKPAFVQENTPVTLAWEAVYSKNPNTEDLPDMPGVNVISPTWFSLADDEGNVSSKVDEKLVKWAHAQDKFVWGLYSNSFEPERTTAALSTYERRSKTINQLLQYMEQYNLDGINIDYENVNVEDRDKLTQFVRELTPQFHRNGLVVSIDVTAKSSSGKWSMFLDREALGRSVDYMMVMAYDEHWATSPEAGSVSSLPWAEQAVRRIMEEDDVPANKLVLGMPLYTRIWTETVENGETKVSSKTIGMESMKKWIAENNVEPVMSEETGQHYAEVSKDGQKQRVWIEDTTSINSRIQMAQDMKLGGVAVWARSFGDEELWKMLKYE